MNSNSSSAAAVNKTFEDSVGRASTAVPDFFTMTRLRGWAWLCWISCKASRSDFSCSICFCSFSRWALRAAVSLDDGLGDGAPSDVPLDGLNDVPMLEGTCGKGFPDESIFARGACKLDRGT